MQHDCQYLENNPVNNTSFTVLHVFPVLYVLIYTCSCSCFVNVQAIRTSLTCTPDAEESSELTQLQHITLDVREVKEKCQSLMKRQAAFEQELTSRLDQMQCYLDELVVLAPTPDQTMQPAQEEFAASTPKSAHPTCDHSTFNRPEIPSTLHSQLTEAITETMGDPDLHVPPSSLSLIHANSCSRENFASKLVKEIFTTEERLASNVKGVWGRTNSMRRK